MYFCEGSIDKRVVIQKLLVQIQSDADNYAVCMYFITYLKLTVLVFVVQLKYFQINMRHYYMKTEFIFTGC